MRIQLNGEPATAPEGATVAVLLEQLRLAGKRLAVERNGEIVPRSAYAGTVIDEGDRIEIVHAIGGG